MANDSASQSIVTVRQMFSDDPAEESRVTFFHFGGAPFRPSRPPGLAMGY